eukprot:14514902-Alexandrium_andersonii.AAC.1
MSASLVGSEMCIRDSPISAPEASASAGAAPAGTNSITSFWVAAVHHGTACLLYTSDAADDM